ncbi:MAG: F510_1955 family glycosylhydrolase [Actinomycetota bacterium]
MAKKQTGPTPRREPEEKSRASRSARGSFLPVVLVIGALVLALVFVFARDNSVAPVSPVEVLASDPGPIHVHGLGINPADGALFIATHTGLWRTAAGETKARRVGNHQQDTMGFTIIGPDRFLGSGHPDQQQYRDEGLPPLLGLIESTDGGDSWQPISLLGKADFHVLRSHGSRVYGFDSTNERLMFSRDAGRTWTKRRPPAPLIDMAVDPSNPSHLIASGEGGLWNSSNEGRTWAFEGGDIGLLAWPIPKRLYLVTTTGDTRVSQDGGKRWKTAGDVGGESAALLAQTERELYVALHDGTVKHSADGGGSWSIRSTP